MAVTAYVGRLRRAGISLNSADLAHSSHSTVPTTASAETLSNRHVQDPLLAQNFLSSIYPKLRRHYYWFRETQRGQIREFGREARSRTEAYRWRGRTADHVLTSGLDDYPRARPPHLGELHLDLISWMGFFSRTMSEIAEYLGEEDDFTEYQAIYKAILGNIEGQSQNLLEHQLSS
jgi:mannosyl-oligosaccharide glucosidase